MRFASLADYDGVRYLCVANELVHETFILIHLTDANDLVNNLNFHLYLCKVLGM